MAQRPSKVSKSSDALFEYQISDLKVQNSLTIQENSKLRFQLSFLTQENDNLRSEVTALKDQMKVQEAALSISNREFEEFFLI
ncbi:20516_t:CDS:2, partial [Dentiscutata erythropus]